MTGTVAETVRIVRILPAPPEEVFEAWTDPVAVGVWMCPETITKTEAQLDVRVGGQYTIAMYGTGREIVHTGEYVEVAPPRRLTFTWVSSETEDRPTLVTVELRPHGSEETELTLTHEKLPHEAAVASHTRGWKACLTEFSEYLGAAKNG